MYQFKRFATSGSSVHYTVEELHPTASFVDGISKKDETEQRIYGCELIQQAGFLLRLHQVTTATGQVLFQRFYHNESMKQFDIRFIAMGALFLASKVEENMRTPREAVTVFYHILQPTLPPLEIPSQKYWDLKEGMFQAEMRILRSLGFQTNIQHPHKFLLMYSKILSLNVETLQYAWNTANDSLKTSVVIRWGQSPWVIASACIYYAARQLKISLPPLWYELFDSTLNEMLEVIGELVDLYSRTDPAEWKHFRGAKIPYGLDQFKEDKIPPSPSTRKLSRVQHSISSNTSPPVKRRKSEHRSYSRSPSRSRSPSPGYRRASPPSRSRSYRDRSDYSSSRHRNSFSSQRSPNHRRDRRSPRRRTSPLRRRSPRRNDNETERRLEERKRRFG